MTRRNDIQTIEDIFDQSWREIDQILRDRLKASGIQIGATVRYCGDLGRQSTFRITRIDTTASREMKDAKNKGSAYAAAYGNLLRKDGTWGTEVRYIGRPHDLEVLE